MEGDYSMTLLSKFLSKYKVQADLMPIPVATGNGFELNQSNVDIANAATEISPTTDIAGANVVGTFYNSASTWRTNLPTGGKAINTSASGIVSPYYTMLDITGGPGFIAAMGWRSAHQGFIRLTIDGVQNIISVNGFKAQTIGAILTNRNGRGINTNDNNVWSGGQPTSAAKMYVNNPTERWEKVLTWAGLEMAGIRFGNSCKIEVSYFDSDRDAYCDWFYESEVKL